MIFSRTEPRRGCQTASEKLEWPATTMEITSGSSTQKDELMRFYELLMNFDKLVMNFSGGNDYYFRKWQP